MPGDVNARSGRTIRSVGIAFDIIDYLRSEGRTGLSELARELDHSKSTIHSHLRTLEGREMIVRTENGYRLSLTVLAMARSVRKQIGNYDVIRDEVDKLADQTGEIVQFGLEEHGKVSYLYKNSGELGVETASRIGSQQPLYSTALGKTVLAHMPRDRAQGIIEDLELTAKTQNTVTSAEGLTDELAEISEQGYGVDDEENVDGLRCVAAPVTSDDAVLGAVSVTGPSSRFGLDEIQDTLSNDVKRAANVIELNTKFA